MDLCPFEKVHRRVLSIGNGSCVLWLWRTVLCLLKMVLVSMEYGSCVPIEGSCVH